MKNLPLKLFIHYVASKIFIEKLEKLHELINFFLVFFKIEIIFLLRKFNVSATKSQKIVYEQII